MTAFNVVRFRVKPGRDKEFLDIVQSARTFPGLRRLSMVSTGQGGYCAVGEWNSFDSIVAARPIMIQTLDSFRACLEDLGGGLGVTDPVSGKAVFERKASLKPGSRRKAKRAGSAPKKKPAKKKSANLGKRKRHGKRK